MSPLFQLLYVTNLQSAKVQTHLFLAVQDNGRGHVGQQLWAEGGLLPHIQALALPVIGQRHQGTEEGRDVRGEVFGRCVCGLVKKMVQSGDGSHHHRGLGVASNSFHHNRYHLKHN